MSSQDVSPFAQRLRHFRRLRGLTQEALAERAGLSTDAVRALERGRRSAPRAVTLGLLAEALDLSGPDRATLVAATARGAGAARSPLPLPLPPDQFVGRERELSAIIDLLGQDHGRLVTLLGPGGVGKTRLALEVLARQETGVFVDLAPLQDPALVPVTIAHAAGVREAGQHDPWQRLLEDLQERDRLLVLDNFEQVIDAAPVIGEALAHCPRLRLLVTSRRALRLRGEQRFPVAPLATATTAPGEAGAAVRLFVSRARAVDPGFAPDATTMATIASICERLDGLPLAIELAAARIGLLPLDALLQRLNQRLALLTGGGRDLPGRHQTMRAAVEWSYLLLSPPEQAAFRRLAVFRGGATLDAATSIVTSHASMLAPGDVLATITALLDGSLIGTTTGPSGAPRLEMLETVHEYAVEQLTRSGEDEAMRSAHAGYFLALAERIASRFASTDEASEFAALERDHDNLRAALAWSLTTSPAAGLRLAAALWQFWWAHGHVTEGREWLERLLAAAPEPSHDRARAHFGAGYLAMQQSDWSPARRHLEAGLTLARRLGDARLTARLLEELGWLLTYEDDLAEARTVLDEALAVSRTVPGDSAVLEIALLNLARLVRHQGEIAYARRLLLEALDLATARQAPRSIAAVQAVLGDIGLAGGDIAAAETHYAAALSAARAADHTTYVAWATVGLGQVAMWRGENERARTLMERGLARYRAVGNTHSLGFVFHLLGITALRAGDLEGAAARFQESLRLRWSLNVRGNVAASLEGLGLVATTRGDFDRALRLFGAANAARASVGAVATPVEAREVGHARDAARAALGAECAAAAWDAGRATPLATTVHDALDQPMATGGVLSPAGGGLHHGASTQRAVPQAHG